MNTRIGLGGVGALALVLSLLITGVGFTVGPPIDKAAVQIGPEPAKGYTWGPWQKRYYAGTAAECRAARRVISRYWTGPLVYYRADHGCVYRVRMRRTSIFHHPATGDLTRIVQLENTAAVAPVWGMKMQVQVRWDGKNARYVTGTKQCQNWGVVVRTTEKECTIEGSGTPRMSVRMSYDASFVWTDFGFNVRRGAQEVVLGNGTMLEQTKWP